MEHTKISAGCVGRVSRIQHCSTGDGPGIRTTVFLKGCNLHCRWCHNPETISRDVALSYADSLCTRCGRCAAVCSRGAHTVTADGHSVDRTRCVACGECAAVCFPKALTVTAREMTAPQVMAKILPDRPFYEASGGGVTLSGGEPLLQADFCREIAARCADEGIPVLVDTAGNVPYTAFEALLPLTERFYVDLKAATEDDYRIHTGGSLALTLSNITRLITDGASVTVRIPIIPGLSDTADYCRKMAAVLLDTGVREVNLLPFHRLGSGKYTALGLTYPCGDLTPPSKERMQTLCAAFPAPLTARVCS